MIATVNDVNSSRSTTTIVREDPDLSLVRSLQNGEERALDTLMDRHRDGVFRFVCTHVPNEADAWELTQETFVRVYFKIDKFRPNAKFVTWLYHIALNLCRDHSRSRAYHNSLKTTSIEETGNFRQFAARQRQPDQASATHDDLLALEKAIAALPFDLRSALVMTAIEGRSHEEAAGLLGVTIKSIGPKVFRARRILLKKLEKLGL